ncbi:MAG: Crp/Fnr family transcriptional regulator [Kofleriaceae bacterium]|nr:Crp/Fnr family transcriptional regulator [Kofleriaceae bacterium]MBP9169111.1 Crp/Fnr family transcriptional regulator [Kofleriaceae bacterium]MBP9862019.1 Crp/Fnr family transcriptional regulator [Kofleriaceae bacterium]
MPENLIERFARDYPAGEVLFREGDRGQQMFVVQAGSVEIRRRVGDSERIVAVVPPGEFFGEMAILNGRPRSATAIVREPARLLVIESRTFEAMLRGRVEIAVRMIKALAGRLEKANQQIELLLLPNANHRVVQCLRQMADEQLAAGGAHDAAVHLPIRVDELATRVALTTPEVADVLNRLASAQLVMTATDAGLDGYGLVIPEVGRLIDFLEFLELRERFPGH